MDNIFSSDDARFGALGIPPFFNVPALPTIVAEWAAILPLVSHLASYRDDYAIAGRVALKGKVAISVFPKLGTLSGLSRLLRNPRKFLDHASARGGTSRSVWDVRYGSSFPCSNGAAIDLLIDYLQSRRPPKTIKMPEKMDDDPAITGLHTKEKADARHFRRYQTLRVLSCIRGPRPAPRLLPKYSTTIIYLLYAICALGCTAVLALSGAYGTTAVLLCATFSNIAASLIVTVARPPGYLEHHNPGPTGFMLAAPNHNALEWDLFIGDRGVVDSLMNKSLFWIPQTRGTTWFGRWLQIGDTLQLAAMTFTAAQKGWDGVCMAGLLFVTWIIEVYNGRDTNLVHDWLRQESVVVEMKEFEFSGRFNMLGTIQLLTKTEVTSWMDDILAPHPRREAWLRRLIHNEKPDPEIWNPSDIERIEVGAGLCAKMAGIIQREFAPTPGV
ncbi:hypothetical protein CHGG_10923 [Chaetomium globosum CBS 148.51]|uniref:Uncharacterized protein n=1 Tax=Chaetomium globosum (strain ATCC 6205 / CBS 148.51 / DSM 1962 / NBRC 6347 / NRRL 1970) TaxID=306901 RepID=Q2GM81_CHAGB|nr:uncharacterized protein CHGG_10923 [Chaetomium globosum CBS 148.51]EAQ83105.1 hypothetical protein CHGG_10923 [Chaetomium globosum CBS 148.51]